MELWPAAVVVGAYVGVVSLGLFRGSVRSSSQMLLSILKLSALTFLASATCCTPVALTLTVVVAYCLYHSLPSPRLSPRGRAVFITGCDTGLGHLLAKKLDAMGVYVFAGCLYPGGEGETTLKSECSDRLRVITVDVSNPKIVREAAERIQQELHGKELWGVVNNAGMLYIGCLELLTEDDIRRLVDVNFMGQVHVVRAFLPLLRASHGRLVNVASNSGLFPTPYAATYSASKAAVAYLTETLRIELRCWGINVSTIIPSGYRTGILMYDKQHVGDRWWQAATEEVRLSYGQESFYPKSIIQDYTTLLNSDFSGVVDKMADALLEKSPKAFYYKGFLARSIPFLYLHLPTAISDLIVPTLTKWYKFDPPGIHNKISNGQTKTE